MMEPQNRSENFAEDPSAQLDFAENSSFNYGIGNLELQGDLQIA